MMNEQIISIAKGLLEKGFVLKENIENISKCDDECDDVSGDEGGVIDSLIEDARAEGYAQGRNENRVRLTLMSDELRMLPSVLVDAYAELCVAALSDGMEGSRREEVRVPPKTRGWRTSSGQTETRGLAKTSSQRDGRGGPTVKSVRLMALKGSVDRKLRKIARQIEIDMAGNGTTESPRKCSRCGKYGEDNWTWCPWDGAAMQSEDRK